MRKYTVRIDASKIGLNWNHWTVGTQGFQSDFVCTNKRYGYKGTFACQIPVKHGDKNNYKKTYFKKRAWYLTPLLLKDILVQFNSRWHEQPEMTKGTSLHPAVQWCRVAVLQMDAGLVYHLIKSKWPKYITSKER